MTNMKTKPTIPLLLLGILAFASCKREFDGNPDFTEDSPMEVFADNRLLFSKIFRLSASDAYLWFDLRNEVASFSKPAIGIDYLWNGIARYKRLDLRGRLYRYAADAEELTILDYPLEREATGADIVANLVFGFARKQKEGCEAIADAGERSKCERTFVLKIKRIVFKDRILVLERPFVDGDTEAFLTN